MLETEVLETEIAADGQQDRVALGGRPVVELDVRPVGPRTGLRALRPHAGADRCAVAPDSLGDRFRVAGGVVGTSRGPDWTMSSAPRSARRSG